jgi:hypothetical protein
VRYVGFDVLHRDGYPVYEDDELVMIPEIKRCLTTKSWTLTKLTGQERNFCEYINAGSMAKDNCRIAPMHAFWSAAQTSFRNRIEGDLGLPAITANVVAVLQDTYIRETGEVGDIAAVREWLDKFESGDCHGTPDENYQELARVSAGEFDPEDWASMSGMTDMPSHGFDLAVIVPPSWLT